MRTLYLRKENGNNVRKILIDMAYLVSHNKIRLPKIYFEEGLYLPYLNNGQTDKYFLTRDKITSEDPNHYFFDFPFAPEKVENTAT
jgi:hypothetical protein